MAIIINTDEKHVGKCLLKPDDLTRANSIFVPAVVIAVCLISGCVLVGWLTDVSLLRTCGMGHADMKFNSALSLMALALALGAGVRPQAPRWRRMVRCTLATLVVALGALTLTEWLGRVDFGIDELLVRDHVGAVFTSARGRMAPNSALGFLCTGMALMLLDWRRGAATVVVQSLCLFGLTLALLGLVVFIFGANRAYDQFRVTQMAMSTALSFLMLNMGILWSRPASAIVALIRRTDSSGVMVRCMLPSAVVIPVLIAYCCLHTTDTLDWPAGLAFALCAVSTVIILALLVAWCARILRIADNTRTAAADQLAAHAQAAREWRAADKERALRAAALEKATEAANAANHAKSLFLNNMSHELRTPLNAIIGFAQMLEDRLFGDINPKQERFIGHISRSGAHLLKMINEILDLSLVESGKIALVRGPVDLQLVATEVRDLLAPLCIPKQLTVLLQVPSLRVNGDPDRIRQVLVNLVANAIKFTPPSGRIVVTAELLDREPVRLVRLHVIDSGIGIKSEDLGRLFVEFSRLDDSYANAIEGSGLGLALCRRIVELHGGTISAASAGEGRGSTFTIELPESQSPPRAVPPLPGRVPEAGVPLSKTRPVSGLILVVEDELSTQAVIADVLLGGSYDVLVATHVEHAMAHVLEQPPNLVILDLVLAGSRSGWEVLEALQASVHTRGIPVIVLSTKDVRVRALAMGARATLIKPVDPSLLQEVVKSTLRRQRISRTALVVDDDPMVLKYLSFALRERGWHVLTASTGEDALNLTSLHAPHVAIVDQGMRGPTGVDLDEHWSQMPISARMPVVVHGDHPLTEADLKRLKTRPHAIVGTLQADMLLAAAERLCDETVDADSHHQDQEHP